MTTDPPATTASGPTGPPPPSSAEPPPADGPPPEPSPGTRARSTPIPQLVTDLRDLVVAYVKQETLTPLQSLGRWIGFGIGGSLLMGFGVVFLAMAALRALQTETGETFTGNWSWVPYVIVVFVLLIMAALVWIARAARRAEKESR